MAKKKELFDTMAKAWFPDRPEDPNMELVEVHFNEGAGLTGFTQAQPRQ